MVGTIIIDTLWMASLRHMVEYLDQDCAAGTWLNPVFLFLGYAF